MASENLQAIESKIESATLAEIEKLQPVLDRYGVSAVAGTTFVEGFGVPAPGQTMLIAASFSAGSHGSGIVVVLVVAWLASMLGNSLGYVIGRRGGRKVIERFSKDQERRARFERTFERYGFGLLVVSRFIDGLRQTASLLAGSLAMPWPLFLIATAIGSTLWVGLWGLGAYVLEQDFHQIVHFFDRTKIWAWVLSALVVLVVVGGVLWRRRARPGTRP